MSKKDTQQVQYLWGLICSLSSIDQQRNNISLFNVISELNLSSKHFSASEKSISSLFPHELVAVFRRRVGSALCTNKIVVDVKVSLIDPSENILSELVTPMPFNIGLRTMRFRLQIDGLKLTTWGDYVYRLEIKKPEDRNFELIAEIPFEVKMLDK